MIDGNSLKERIYYYQKRLKTTEGRIDIFVTTTIWGFLIASISQIIYSFWYNIFNIPISLVRLMLTYFAIGLTYIFFGLPLTFIIDKSLMVIKKYVR